MLLSWFVVLCVMLKDIFVYMCLPFFVRNLCVLVLTGSQWSLIVDARLREGVVIHCVDTHVCTCLSLSSDTTTSTLLTRLVSNTPSMITMDQIDGQR